MQKGIRKLVAAVSALGLIAGCSEIGKINASRDSASALARYIRSFVHYDRLPRGYESRVRKLLEVAEKQEERLQYHEEKNEYKNEGKSADKSPRYGRHGQDTKARAIALVQKFKLACKLAAENATELVFHHGPAPQLAQRDYIAATASH